MEETQLRRQAEHSDLLPFPHPIPPYVGVSGLIKCPIISLRQYARAAVPFDLDRAIDRILYFVISRLIVSLGMTAHLKLPDLISKTVS